MSYPEGPRQITDGVLRTVARSETSSYVPPVSVQPQVSFNEGYKFGDSRHVPPPTYGSNPTLPVMRSVEPLTSSSTFLSVSSTPSRTGTSFASRDPDAFRKRVYGGFGVNTEDSSDEDTPLMPSCYDEYKPRGHGGDYSDVETVDAPRVLDLLEVLTAKPFTEYLTYRMNKTATELFNLERMERSLIARNNFYIGRGRHMDDESENRNIFAGRRSFTDMSHYLRENMGELVFSDNDKRVGLSDRTETLADKFYDEAVKDFKLIKNAYKEYLLRYDIKLYSSADVLHFLMRPFGFDIFRTGSIRRNFLVEGLQSGIDNKLKAESFVYGANSFFDIAETNYRIFRAVYSAKRPVAREQFNKSSRGLESDISRRYYDLALGMTTEGYVAPELYAVFYKTNYTYYGTFGALNGYGQPRMLVGVSVDVVYIEPGDYEEQYPPSSATSKDAKNYEKPHFATITGTGNTSEFRFEDYSIENFIRDTNDDADGNGIVDDIANEMRKFEQQAHLQRAIIFDRDEDNLALAAKLGDLVDMELIRNSLAANRRGGHQVLMLLDGDDFASKVALIANTAIKGFESQRSRSLLSMLESQLTLEFNNIYMMTWGAVTDLQIDITTHLSRKMLTDAGFSEDGDSGPGMSECHTLLSELMFDSVKNGVEAKRKLRMLEEKFGFDLTGGSTQTSDVGIAMRIESMRRLNNEITDGCDGVVRQFRTSDTNLFLLSVAKACELLSIGEEPVQYSKMGDKHRDERGNEINVTDDADGYVWNEATRSLDIDGHNRGLVRDRRRYGFVERNTRSEETMVMAIGYNAMTTYSTFAHLIVATSGVTALMCQLALSPLNFSYSRMYEGARFVNYFPEPYLTKMINVNNYGAFRRLYAPSLMNPDEQTVIGDVSSVYNLERIGIAAEAFNTFYFNLTIFDVLNVERGNHRKDSGDFNSNAVTALRAAYEMDDAIRNVSMVKESFITRSVTVTEAIHDKDEAEEALRAERILTQGLTQEVMEVTKRGEEKLAECAGEITKLSKAADKRKESLGSTVDELADVLAGVNVKLTLDGTDKSPLEHFIAHIIGKGDDFKLDDAQLKSLKHSFGALTTSINNALLNVSADGSNKSYKGVTNFNEFDDEYT